MDETTTRALSRRLPRAEAEPERTEVAPARGLFFGVLLGGSLWLLALAGWLAWRLIA